MKKIIIPLLAIVIVAVIGIVAVQMNKPEPVAVMADASTAEPTEAPTTAPTPEPTEEPTLEPTAEPTPEPTPEPTEVPFSWKNVESENDILYATLAGAKYMAEPREDADLVTEPAVDTELYIEAVAYVDGVPSIYIKTTYEGNPVYVDTTYIAEVVKEVADDTTSATTDEQPADEQPADEQPAYLTKSLDEMTLSDLKQKIADGYKLTSEEKRRFNDLIGAPQTPHVGYGVAEEPSQESIEEGNQLLRDLGITFQ